MTCGQCQHWDRNATGIRHIRLGCMGRCRRAEGECRNERGQYWAKDDEPRLRFENEPAGAHYTPIAAKAGR